MEILGLVMTTQQQFDEKQKVLNLLWAVDMAAKKAKNHGNLHP